MKVLIISRTTWDNANSFGNTFSNLFEGMKDVEIYSIACRNGISNNSITDITPITNFQYYTSKTSIIQGQAKPGTSQ